jgi:hypothetical protein
MAHQGLWLCGPPGVGKSTVGYELFVAIYRTGRKAGYVDADQVGMCHPASSDDPHNHTLKAPKVGAVWRNFQAEARYPTRLGVPVVMTSSCRAPPLSAMLEPQCCRSKTGRRRCVLNRPLFDRRDR